jgi:hypothetical protein
MIRRCSGAGMIGGVPAEIIGVAPARMLAPGAPDV